MTVLCKPVNVDSLDPVPLNMDVEMEKVAFVFIFAKKHKNTQQKYRNNKF